MYKSLLILPFHSFGIFLKVTRPVLRDSPVNTIRVGCNVSPRYSSMLFVNAETRVLMSLLWSLSCFSQSKSYFVYIYIAHDDGDQYIYGC
jgi:hypothetical protein